MPCVEGTSELGSKRAVTSQLMNMELLPTTTRAKDLPHGLRFCVQLRANCNGVARHLPRRLPTLAWHSHHIASGCASDRGQPAPARGVRSVRAPRAMKTARRRTAMPRVGRPRCGVRQELAE